MKDKVEYLVTFEPHDLTAKTEHTEDLESFLAQALQEPGAMKTSDFKKRHDCAEAVKANPKIELKTGERKKQEEKVEDARVNELARTTINLQEQIKQLSDIIATLFTPRHLNEENLARINIEQMSNKKKQSVEETKKQ